MFTIPKMQNYWFRQNIVICILAVLLIVFSYRIITIHKLQAGNISLKERADNQSTEFFLQKASRGIILDKNNNVLAGNVLLKKINLDPSLVQIEFIPQLAQALAMDEVELANILAKKRKINSKYLIIKKNLELTNPIIKNVSNLKRESASVCRIKAVVNKDNLFERVLVLFNLKTANSEQQKVCKEERIHGVAIQQNNRRYYPKSASIAPLIGRINKEQIGISGIESEFENTLSGKNGKTKLQHKQDNLYFTPIVVDKLKNGRDIQLTIDSDIQFYVYTAVKNSVIKHEANAGSAIVLNIDGEVLAMVNYPAEDPNDKSSYNADNYRNRVLSDKIEPGSTMKPFIALLALDKAKITATEDEFIDVSKQVGHIKPDGKYEKLTVKKILQKSHNLGIVKISEKLDNKDIYATWKNLGFGSPLGLMPSIENLGSLKHFSLWSPSDKHTLAFGHGPMETSLAQLARAYLVFANKGKILSLKLIKNINIDASSIKVFSEQSIDKVSNFLNAVVSNEGSGYRAQIKGYDVAGKTGTAELIIDGVYNKEGAKRTFFVGFVPAKNPQYIMAVQLDYPKKCVTSWNVNIQDKCQGSNSAAITFREAMKYILTASSVSI